MPLRVQVYDEADGTCAAAWAAGGFVDIWRKPLLYGVGPSCLCGCDGWFVEGLLPFTFLGLLH